MEIKLVKMGEDINKDLNHRVRGIVKTKDNKYLFIELLRGHRPDRRYTNYKKETDYFEAYPHEYYIFLDFCFRVDVPEDYYKNYTKEYAEFTRQSFRNIPHTKEGIIKLLQILNSDIEDYELTDNNYIDEFCKQQGFYKLYDAKLHHRVEPLKIVAMYGDIIHFKTLYTAWNYNQSIEFTEIWENKMNMAEFVETPDGRKITAKERFIEQYGVDTLNILIEEYKQTHSL